MSKGHTTSYQLCNNCGHVGEQQSAIVYSSRGHGEFLDRRECERCASRDVDPCFACTDCHAALPVIEDHCVPCCVKFFTTHPLDFDPNEKAPGGALFWRLTPEHAEAAHQIQSAIERHNGVKAA